MRKILRMMNANLNRLSEGMRTVEDVMRFGYDHAAMSARARSLRHAFGATVRRLVPSRRLLESRESLRDVGASRWRDGQARAGLYDVVCANFRRAQESARVLEEGARLLHHAATVRSLQRLRYRCYEFERSACRVVRRRG